MKRYFYITTVLVLFLVITGSFPTFAKEKIKINADIITTQAQGEECFKEARNILKGLGMVIPREILLKVRPRDEVQVHYVSGGGLAIGVGGYYQSHGPEQIWIVKGQSRNRTISDMVHELTHAWQSTECPLQDRTIKEGLAVWCQYKALIQLGEKDLANRLTKWKDPDYGGGLRLFLRVEKKGGVPAVLEYAKKTRKPPKGYDDEFKNQQ